MKIPIQGTEKWFEYARQKCVDHLRALLSIRSSHENILRILDRWGREDPAVLAALHSAAVTAYARPFTGAETRFGKVKYQESSLKGAMGFDRELHTHLLNLRNKMIAHADYDVLASTMYVQTVGDEQLPLSIGINVKVIFGIESRELADRYLAHFGACMTAIETTLNQELNELAAEAKKYPLEFGATHNLPVASSKMTINGEDQVLPGPTGQAAGVAEPQFAETLAGYSYMTLQHERPLIQSGTYTIHENGIPKEIVFAVG